MTAEKTKYVVMSRDQCAGQNYKENSDNLSFDRVEEFKYRGTTPPIKIPFRKKLRIDLVREFLLSFGAESFAFQSANQKYKDEDIKGKGKAIPLQAWTGPEVSRTLRLPDFKTIGT